MTDLWMLRVVIIPVDYNLRALGARRILIYPVRLVWVAVQQSDFCALSTIRCMTLCRLLKFSELQFAHQ